MATYNDGLYTPWTPATTVAAATLPAAVWEPATSSTIDAVSTTPEGTTVSGATTSSTSMTTQATTTTQWWTTSSSRSSSSSSSSTSSSTSSSSPTPSSSSTSSSSSSASSMPTSSSSTLHSSLSISSSMSHHSSSASASASTISDASSSSGSFKITYLLPVFIIVPCVSIFLLLAWTYGKYWAKPGDDGAGESAHSTSYWYAGRGGTYNSGRRNEEDVDLDDEKGALVEGRWVGDEEKGAGGGGGGGGALDKKVSGRWRGWLPLGRGGTKHSHNSLEVPFVSVSYASLDQPFLPPSNSNRALSRSATQTSDRGWTWGTKPQATTSALRDANDESSRHLTANGWGGTARKYRAKSARSKTGSMGSRLSDKIFRRLSGGGGGIEDDTAPSPSVYSPAFEPGHRGGGPGGGIYAELDGEDDDAMEELDDEKKVDLDAYLGESRVGEGELARRYISGEVTERDFAAIPPSRSASRHYLDDDQTKTDYYARQGLASAHPPPRSSSTAFDAPPLSFAVNLPSAPPRTQVSPKKSKSSLLRPPPPETPSATPPPQLLFNYDSPPVPRPPLPVPGNQTSFTAQPPRIPFRNQAAPQLSRPRRSNTATPFSPETAPGLFFASPPMNSPPSSSGHANVGSAMPDFQPGALRASESAFSLAGVDRLIFGDAGRSESRAGLKELVEAERKPKSRREEIEQLKRSAPAVVPSSSAAANLDPHSSSQAKNTAAPVSSSRPLSEQLKPTQPRESLGFDPVFSDSPPIPPLQHPSKVRAAIETLEARSSAAGHHQKTSSQDSGRSSRSPVKRASPTPRLPSPPAPQKLERSTTTLGRNYRRRHGGGFDYSEDEGDDDDYDNDDDDEALKKDRRVSMLLLNRGRTQSGPVPTASSQDSHEESGSAEHDARPLSSDPARLQQMLRRKSVGDGLGGGHESGGVRVDEDGNVGGGLLGLMTRRSGLFE
ncbi:hypothetical protein JCM1840_002296 [Sporobolomyces johnsonii]